jgi:hypothetical protein
LVLPLGVLFTQTVFVIKSVGLSHAFASNHLDVMVVKPKRGARVPALKHASIFEGFRLA